MLWGEGNLQVWIEHRVADVSHDCQGRPVPGKYGPHPILASSLDLIHDHEPIILHNGCKHRSLCRESESTMSELGPLLHLLGPVHLPVSVIEHAQVLHPRRVSEWSGSMAVARLSTS
jgi:hypothetical protein